MLHIGRSRIVYEGETARLCAEVSVGNRAVSLWFGVDRVQADYLAVGRSDPFVMALLAGAMRGGHEIVCEDPMSQRLHYQLTEDLIPTLTFAGKLYHPVKITAPLTAEGLPNQKAVGTGFSGGVDSLYTVVSHGPDCEFPLSHVVVFNNGHMSDGHIWGKDVFGINREYARRFAAEQGLEAVMMDTNLPTALPERFLDVYSFRNYACALALGRLFSVYLLSSGHDAANFQLDLRNTATFDLLNARCASTESLAFYHAGEEVRRWEKLQALSDWEPSWRWLHPCFQRNIDQPNCGHCKKCVRDMTTLYALGRLERYRAVYDVDDYLRDLPRRMGVLLAHSDGHLYDETIQLLRERGGSIPQRAFLYERQFRRAMDYLRTKKTEMISDVEDQ